MPETQAKRDIEELRIWKNDGFFGVTLPVMYRLEGTSAATALNYSAPFFIAQRDYYLISVTERHEVKGNTGTLAYSGQTGNFTVGQVVTGGTSGATGTIAADADSGTSGTLTLTGITGLFVAGEAITDPITGAATVASVLGGLTMMLKKVPSGTAPASGTDMLSTGLTLNSIANTNQEGTLVTTAGGLTIPRGYALSFILTGTPTAVQGVTASVVLKAV